MSENMAGKEERQENQRSITAIELAELVINVTSELIPIISALDGDNETKQKIIQVLQALQRKAIEYTIAAAKRSQSYARRRGSTWRARTPRRTYM